jgi:hypothetical protein
VPWNARWLLERRAFRQIVPCLLLGSPALISWFFFLRYKQRVQRDVDGRIIEVLDGLPEEVEKRLNGMCFVFLGGKRIRVPFEYYEELANATSVTLEYLPESRIALYVRSRRELLKPGRFLQS